MSDELRKAARELLEAWQADDPGAHHRALIALRAALATPERPCTCHPDDNPPVPCARKYALSECKATPEPSREPTQPVTRDKLADALRELLAAESDYNASLDGTTALLRYRWATKQARALIARIDSEEAS
jgi:hypothetical protein